MSKYDIHATPRTMKEIKKKLALSDLKQKAHNEAVRDWLSFSMNPQSEENIKKRVRYDMLNGYNTCCVTYICRYSVLSEELIEWLITNTYSSKTNNNKVDWEYISTYQNLSEKFITKHEKEVSWPRIFQYQKLSEKFKEKYAKKLLE